MLRIAGGDMMMQIRLVFQIALVISMTHQPLMPQMNTEHTTMSAQYIPTILMTDNLYLTTAV